VCRESIYSDQISGHTREGCRQGSNLRNVPTIIVASDAPTLRAEITSSTSRPGTTIVEARSGPEVMALVAESEPDLVIVDMQIGNMGGMAICLELRLEASYDKIGRVPVLMLLDRRPDVFLAKRSGADGWLVKPLDPIRLRHATTALLDGRTYFDESYAPLSVPAPGAAASPGS
jgi:DNA-binding response OmpR family regulator